MLPAVLTAILACGYTLVGSYVDSVLGRYKAGLGTMSDEELKKLDKVYCDTNRAKAGHTNQVHNRFTFMGLEYNCRQQ